MVGKDVLLFFVIYSFFIFVSSITQLVILRIMNPKGFFTQILGLPIIIVITISICCHFFISRLFNNVEMYYALDLGAGLSAVFSLGLLTLVGPITADRSTAAQMLLLLYDAQDGLSTEDLSKNFNVNNILEKRYEEFENANIIFSSKERIRLTPKGRVVAMIYKVMFNCVDLSHKNQYRNYFIPNKKK